jgi:hypothetical protein
MSAMTAVVRKRMPAMLIAMVSPWLTRVVSKARRILSFFWGHVSTLIFTSEWMRIRLDQTGQVLSHVLRIGE